MRTSALSSPSALSWADLQISLVQACSCQGWALPSLPRWSRCKELGFRSELGAVPAVICCHGLLVFAA